jgi:hypothetical protein
MIRVRSTHILCVRISPPKGFRARGCRSNRDPLSVPANLMLALASYALHRYDDTVRQCERTIDLDAYLPRAPRAARRGSRLYGFAFRSDSCRAARPRNLPVGAFSTAIVTAEVAVNLMPGQRRRATELLKSSSKLFWPRLHTLVCAAGVRHLRRAGTCPAPSAHCLPKARLVARSRWFMTPWLTFFDPTGASKN